MNKDSSARQPNWMGWTLCLLAVPVVYLLTLYPLSYAVMYDRKTNLFNMGPSWLQWYSKPGDWMYYHVPFLKGPADEYMSFWMEAFTGRKVP